MVGGGSKCYRRYGVNQLTIVEPRAGRDTQALVVGFKLAQPLAGKVNLNLLSVHTPLLPAY